jgi:GT2 family glycosyltransferase
MFDLIVANYNNSSFLLEFFKSISDSTLRPAKIIFVDDCSSDNSLQLIEETKFLEGLNIQVLKNEVNIGFANSLNKAIDEISAPFFARLDPDDFVSVHRFEKQFNYLKNNPHIDLVGSNVNYVLKGNVIGQSNVPLKPSKIKDIIVSGILPLIHGSIMGTTDILADFRYNQDLVPAENINRKRNSTV